MVSGVQSRWVTLAPTALAAKIQPVLPAGSDIDTEFPPAPLPEETVQRLAISEAEVRRLPPVSGSHEGRLDQGFAAKSRIMMELGHNQTDASPPAPIMAAEQQSWMSAGSNGASSALSGGRAISFDCSSRSPMRWSTTDGTGQSSNCHERWTGRSRTGSWLRYFNRPR
jgi:hypothetical protein